MKQKQLSKKQEKKQRQKKLQREKFKKQQKQERKREKRANGQASSENRADDKSKAAKKRLGTEGLSKRAKKRLRHEQNRLQAQQAVTPATQKSKNKKSEKYIASLPAAKHVVPSAKTATYPGSNKGKKLSLLQKKMQGKIQGAQFRFLNEQLYTTTGTHAFDQFQKEPELFDVYHAGFRQQVVGWPVNPLDQIISWLQVGTRTRCRCYSYSCLTSAPIQTTRCGRYGVRRGETGPDCLQTTYGTQIIRVSAIIASAAAGTFI